MLAPHDRILAARTPGIYESHYLKANDPDRPRAFWIKHTLMHRKEGPSTAELWFIWFEGEHPPRVLRWDAPWSQLELGPGLHLQAPGIRLDPRTARGALGAVRWDLALRGPGTPLLHLPHQFLYRVGFPRKKLLTPAPALRFDGEIRLGDRAVEVRGWTGLRGHNWGTEHAPTYAYGNCQLWEDGAPRLVDGFTARIRLAGRLLPPLSGLVVREGEREHAFNRIHQWPGHGRFDPEGWELRYRPLTLRMDAPRSPWVGLRYNQPGGGEGYCYNTKFAPTRLVFGNDEARSEQGELELFFSEPLPDIPLHPSPAWHSGDDPYDSEPPHRAPRGEDPIPR